MPPSTDILSGLTAIANDWRLVAIVWHVLLGAFLLGLVAGWRPLTRDIGLLLVAPLVSVSTLAWMSGNPFNAVVFALLSLALSWLAVRLPRIAVRIDSPVRVAAGALLVVFGWVYPHFLRTDAWTAYLYAAPLGLVPCPTLSAIVGLSLIGDLSRSRPWAVMLCAAGVVYGAIGVLRLGVGIDVVLVAGALCVGLATIRG